MNAPVTIDKAGRVVIPKEIRHELRLEAGDTLALESEGERVTLQRVRGGTPLRKERRRVGSPWWQAAFAR